MLAIFSRISPRLLLGGGAAILLGLLVWSWHSRGNTIDDLRGDLDQEQFAHSVTRSSLKLLRSDLDRQNAEIERQRVNAEQARADLAAAEAASASSASVIEKLRASARATHAGPVCEPSAVAKEVWK